MIFETGVEIEDSLIDAFIECGNKAHEIAKAHHLEAGSNSFTFGADRYHRATELSIPSLEEAGFEVSRKGAGLRAVRDDLELHFGTARGSDLTKKDNFDIGASHSRQRAGLANLESQPAFEGIEWDNSSRSIFHVIWSGDLDEGLTAVYVGKLIATSGQHLEWEELVRVDNLGDSTTLNDLDTAAIPLPTYEQQPEPVFQLDLIEDAKKNVE